MTSKIYNDNKDLTAGIDAHVPLYWRVLCAVAVPVLFVAVAIVGFRLALSVGVAS